MKIAVFQNFPPGGGKRTVYEQVKGLMSRHIVEVYELSNPGSWFFDLKHLGCPVHSYPFTKVSKSRLYADFKNFFVLAQVHRKIANDINRGGFDVVLVHPDEYTESPFILRYLKVPNVYHCHELLRIGYEHEYAFSEKVIWPKRFYELFTRRIRVMIDRTNARAAGKIITNTKFIQAKILSAYGRSSTICYSGVDPLVFKPSAPKQAKVLLMGSKTKVGGYEFVLQVFSLLPKNTPITLEMFGFSGGKPDVDSDALLSRAYSSSLATICASYSEPFGLKAIESMSCGTPPLCVNEGGYRESVINGQTGWLLPRDPNIFAQKIVYLSRHPEVSQRMGRAGRKDVLKRWTWTRHVRQLEKILQNAS